MTLLLDNDAVRFCADTKHIIAALEEGLCLEAAGSVASVPRINLAADGTFFRVMPAIVPGMDLMGMKAFHGSASAGVRYLVALYRVSTGELLCLMDASYLTAVRTGALTGLATRAMTDDSGCKEVGIIGSGLEARTNLEAICAVRPVRHVTVYSPNAARREAFAREMSERLGIDVHAATAAREAADAQVVLVATNTGSGSETVALKGEWLRDAGHVNTIGSTTPALREVDPEVFRWADLIVLDTEHAGNESGDLQAAVAHGAWDQSKVRGLTDLVGRSTKDAGHRPMRTVFKSVGTALQDVVAAGAVYEAAREHGRGTEVELLGAKFFDAERARA